MILPLELLSTLLVGFRSSKFVAGTDHCIWSMTKESDDYDDDSIDDDPKVLLNFTKLAPSPVAKAIEMQLEVRHVSPLSVDFDSLPSFSKKPGKVLSPVGRCNVTLSSYMQWKLMEPQWKILNAFLAELALLSARRNGNGTAAVTILRLEFYTKVFPFFLRKGKESNGKGKTNQHQQRFQTCL